MSPEKTIEGHRDHEVLQTEDIPDGAHVEDDVVTGDAHER